MAKRRTSIQVAIDKLKAQYRRASDKETNLMIEQLRVEDEINRASKERRKFQELLQQAGIIVG